MTQELLEILGKILALANSQAGQSALLQMFAEKDISASKLDEIIKKLPDPQPPKE